MAVYDFDAASKHDIIGEFSPMNHGGYQVRNLWVAWSGPEEGKENISISCSKWTHGATLKLTTEM